MIPRKLHKVMGSQKLLQWKPVLFSNDRGFGSVNIVIVLSKWTVHKPDLAIFILYLLLPIIKQFLQIL